ncbi:hypothetical protein PPACK8108_LOCUS12545 [Phakopsora pachyrhizi]|uniref:Uncharacterized protein n=1 Tax=Phakopsora pachyrhizi TaxID=170000 RepID=A0AAV0B6V4_PHAPC|nr:hypothetical protein PPACK8108_LOCUS12545 [Phakopsora pachyrhizi]
MFSFDMTLLDTKCANDHIANKTRMILPGLIVGRRELRLHFDGASPLNLEADSFTKWGEAGRARLKKLAGGVCKQLEPAAKRLLIGALNKSNLPQSIGRQYELNEENRRIVDKADYKKLGNPGDIARNEVLDIFHGMLDQLPRAIKKEISGLFVLDAEAVAQDLIDKRILPFQELSKLKRKDLWYLNDEPMINREFSEGRRF